VCLPRQMSVRVSFWPSTMGNLFQKGRENKERATVKLDFATSFNMVESDTGRLPVLFCFFLHLDAKQLE